MKLFMKCFRKLSTILREMFMISVQYLHKILQESFRIFFRNDSGNVSTTYLVNFLEIFLVEILIYCGKFSETFHELFHQSFFAKKLETLQEIFPNDFRKISRNNHNLDWKFFNEY